MEPLRLARTSSFLSLALFAAAPLAPALSQEPGAERRWHEDVKTPREPDTLPPFDGGLSEGGPRAAADSTPAVRVARRASPRIDHSVVYWDAPGDGSLWARGSGYKASFDARGATILPYLGAAAPRNVEIPLSPDLATLGGAALEIGPAVVSRSGDRVEIDRGSFVERYDLVPGSLEQSFVFGALPGEGDLVLNVPLACTEPGLELAPVEDGLEVRSASRLVRYGRAVAFDAAGRPIPSSMRVLPHSVEIRVEAADLAGAELPLVIDPPVTPFPIDTGSDDDNGPDTAYDAQNHRWLVVFEETFSSSDHDAFAQLIDDAGNLVGGAYVDATALNWQHVRCANVYSHQTFLVVGAVSFLNSKTIGGRTVHAGTAAMGSQLTVSNGESGELLSPEVGGDFAQSPSNFLVVYQRKYSATDEDVLARLIDPSGAGVGGTIFLSNSGGTQDIFPEMSKSNSASSWLIAWQRNVNDTSTGIWAGRIRRDGTVSAFPFQIINYPYAYTPSVSTALRGSEKNIVTFSALNGSSADSLDVYAYGIDGGSIFWSMDVSRDEWEGQEDRHQLEPEVDSDGQHFVVTYMEQVAPSSDDYDVYATDIGLIDTNLFVSGPRTAVATASIQDIWPRIASAYGSQGPSQRYLAVWGTHDGTQGDVYGGFVEGRIGGKAFGYCFGDGNSTQCPCGNNGASGHGCANSVNPAGAQLFTGGSYSTVNDSTTLTASGVPATATCLFLQGTNTISAPVVFGDGLKCIAGSIVRLGSVVASNGVATYPTPAQWPISFRGNIPLDGGTRYYTCWYRNSANFCTSATSNLTNGAFILWAR